MAELVSIARPYAQAAFDVAREKEQLLSWKAYLAFASRVVKDEQFARLLSNPTISATVIGDLLIDILSTELSVEQKNFLRVLAENRRLYALPDISILFDAQYDALEKMKDVRVITAINVDDHFKQRLSLALTRRLNHAVRLHYDINPDLIGGAIIEIGDHIIDGSLRGKLQRLEKALTS